MKREVKGSMDVLDVKSLTDEQIVEKAKELVKQMTLEEKASLCSGKDFWHTKPVERLGLPSITVSDGPHGLRKQLEGMGMNESVPAVCFPTSSALACSFDRELAGEIGKALGEECQKEGIDVLLGPGANQKRTPLCGRNFEYFSEDPLLSGEMAAAVINGVQSQGVGTSLKHFAANNQETRRMSIDAIIDERAFRDVYLRAFEIAVKKAKPWTVMCAYNKINGTYCSDHAYLLNDILRKEWGFEGLVVSDWCAVNNRVKGVLAGLDLEMPGNDGYNDRKIIEAVNNKTLSESDLDKIVQRVVELILKSMRSRKENASCDMDAHHELAVKAHKESAVLLKNEGGILPGNTSQNAAVIGEMARKPKFQGAGSSKVNPYRVSNAWDELTARGLKADYAPGYLLDKNAGTDTGELIDEACRIARDKEIVYLFAGLPDDIESEGYDRENMSLPDVQNRLIEEVCKVNPNVVVVLACGSPVELPWADKVKGILLAYYGGEGSGEAVADLLLGLAVPSGKLAETWPLSLNDNPSYNYFPGGRTTVEYRESIYVGYRYYEKANKPVRYPFGYGLSYTGFEYSGLKLSKSEAGLGDEIEVSFSIRNTGTVEGKETALVFVAHPDGKMFMPVKELCGFEKVSIKPGGTKNVVVRINTEQFGYYNTEIGKRYAPPGEYRILVGSSSASIYLEDTVKLTGSDMPEPDYRATAPSYYNLSSGSLVIPDEEFAALYGRRLPAKEGQAKRPYTTSNCILDVEHTFIGKILKREVKKKLKKNSGSAADDEALMYTVALEMPFDFLVRQSNGALTDRMMEGILDMLNGHYFKGLWKIIKK